MFTFIRKYQQLFFSVIAAGVIFSMLFFGTFSALSEEETSHDPVIAQAVDGSDFYLSEVQALSRFLASDRADLSHQSTIPPNFCNDGVIRRDLLQSGLANLLVASYFEPFKIELERRVKKAGTFRFYSHPQASNLSARSSWQHFLPKMNQDIDLFINEREVTAKTFALLSDLYENQSYFSPEMLRRILLMQEQQYRDLMPDPKLKQGDFALFGFHSLTDWFGADFVDLCSQFILNGAKLAEQKGYVVSLEEAKGDLLVIFSNSMKELTKAGLKEQPSLVQHLRGLGFDLKSATEVWRKVLLFRRYFQGVSKNIFMDRLPYRDFASYAKETVSIDLYQWPSSLRLKTLDDLIEFQIYLSAISPNEQKSLLLPTQFFSIDEVAKKFPELVPALYRVKLTEMPLQKVALRIPIREVWDWELDETNWKLLQNQFSSLSTAAKTREERFQILKGLDARNRLEIDSYVRMILIRNYPEWISNAWDLIPSEEKVLSVVEGKISLSGIQNGKVFSSLLQSAASGNEEALLSLSSYSDDGKTLYRLEDIEGLPQSILTFQQAREMKVLSHLKSKILQTEYVKIRSQFAEKFKDKKGNWKPFFEVKDKVAKHLFSDVFHSIALLEKKKWTDADYARYRLLTATRIAQEDLKKTGFNSQWVQTEGDPLGQQFKLEKKECKIQRTAKEDGLKNQAFTMVPDQWSAIEVAPNGEISFFYLNQKLATEETPILEPLFFGKEIIGRDAQCYIAERFLKSLKLKKSIVIPLKGEKE